MYIYIRRPLLVFFLVTSYMQLHVSWLPGGDQGRCLRHDSTKKEWSPHGRKMPSPTSPKQARWTATALPLPGQTHKQRSNVNPVQTVLIGYTGAKGGMGKLVKGVLSFNSGC